MDNIIMAILLCQIHVQAVEYILEDQTIKFEQISESDSLVIFINCHSFKKGAVFS